MISNPIWAVSPLFSTALTCVIFMRGFKEYTLAPILVQNCSPEIFVLRLPGQRR